jgi:hypothetical protein
VRLDYPLEAYPLGRGHSLGLSQEEKRVRRNKLLKLARDKKQAQDPEQYVAKRRAAQKRWRQANLEHRREQVRNGLRKMTYGLSPQEYATLVAAHPVCDICGRSGSEKWPYKLWVDHDHSTKKIRGMLCASCNRALGYFRDNPNFCRNAAEYLETER